MKFIRLIFLVSFIQLFFIFNYHYAYAQERVNGYFRSDGTYVNSYYRSDPNNTPIDNYNFKGNINPYTGQVGHNYYRNNPRSPYYSPNFK